MKQTPNLLILPLILLLSACGSLSRTNTMTEYYQLETNLLIDGRPLNEQSIELPGQTTTILYFYDDVLNQTYKVEYAVLPGEQEHTLFIDTQMYRTVNSPNFLVYDNEEAAAVFQEEAPEIEIKVKARQIHRH
ncbi:hypothetical protein GZ77_19790 [Endozoicomonas montiporae]|uniref:Lipoprotein n=2 Tax=Endozoicomonas montiporae TaxID=1027273 RepID=A0A081N2P4_9GAMM|nr:hypothetical protein [Endozoicomonas montiporae]KEQ12717.1 hypothetical protein GZ77_19790 [Endozoicomonas montiporae]